MAVLIEAISVVIRRDAIEQSVPGGWTEFFRVVPNSTLCTDGELARVGFMSPDTVGDFIHELEQLGLSFLEEGSCIDITVVDQQKGPTTTCEWLEFGRLPCDGGEVSACCCQCRSKNRPLCWHKNQPVAVDMRRSPIGDLLIFGVNPGSAFLLRPTLRQSVGLAVHFQNVDVVGQMVEERAGQTFLAEGGGPLVERQV